MTELALLAADTSALDQAADPGEYIVMACERAKAWLTDALSHGDIDQIVELKSQAEAIRVYMAQKQTGKDAEFAAAEIVRRAERGIGVAIRRGQQAGEIGSVGDRFVSRAPDESSTDTTDTTDKRSPRDFLVGGQELADTYAITDGVTDDQFDAAIEHAKAEANLSRANVVRKVKDVTAGLNGKSPEIRLERSRLIRDLAEHGYTSRQMAARVGVTYQTVRMIARDFEIDIPADRLTNKRARLDSTRIVRENVQALEGTAFSLRLIDYDEVDLTEIGDWAISLTESMRALNRFHRRIKEMTQ